MALQVNTRQIGVGHGNTTAICELLVFCLMTLTVFHNSNICVSLITYAYLTTRSTDLVH